MSAYVTNELFQFEYRKFGNKFLKTDSKLLYAFAGNLFGDGIDFHNTEDVFYVIFVNQYLDQDNKYKSQSGWEANIENDCF